VAPPRTLAFVLAGGAGGRLGALTDHRAKPVVPYAGAFRLIDFVLSNCLHAGIADVWVTTQFHPASLVTHLANGRPWDLDRTTGGLLVLPPRKGDDREGWHEGTADALWRHAAQIRDHGPDALVLLSADAVYRMDYDEVVRLHLASDAAVTMVTTRLPGHDLTRYGVVEARRDGTISGYAYKPDEPKTDLVATEVFVCDPAAVLDELERVAADVGEDELGDLGDHLLPRLVEQGRAREHRFDGYWRDVGTVDAYWSSQLDLLDDDTPIDLHDATWPFVTHVPRSAPAYVAPGAAVSGSLLTSGTRVLGGRVERSVLGPGVVVEAGATVVESVLLADVVVRKGATVVRAVLDEGVEAGADERLGEEDGDVTLVGASGPSGQSG
jgi:glucose-1-phosphate adenylyltransferase